MGGGIHQPNRLGGVRQSENFERPGAIDDASSRIVRGVVETEEEKVAEPGSGGAGFHAEHLEDFFEMFAHGAYFDLHQNRDLVVRFAAAQPIMRLKLVRSARFFLKNALACAKDVKTSIV